MLISPKNLSSCAKGAPNVLQFWGPRRQVFVCGVETGGVSRWPALSEAEGDLLLHFAIYSTNLKDRTPAIY